MSIHDYRPHSDILAGGAVNSFRAFYNQPAQVLSIHHYVSPYSHVDYAGLKEIHRCVDSSVAGVSRVKSASWRGRAYLPRNVKATRKRADRTKRLVLSNHLAHITVRAAVFNSENVDGRDKQLEGAVQRGG